MSPKARTKPKPKARQSAAAKAVQDSLIQAKLEAEHAAFLETYEPIITRHPDALAEERAEIVKAEQEAATAAERAQADQDAEVGSQAQAQQEREAEDAAFREKHYPGT